MALIHLNTSVFVGRGFASSFFDEHKLFGGESDPEEELKLGHFALFSYLKGEATFEVTPERIDLRLVSPDIAPDALLEATKAVIEMIEPVQEKIQVSHFGMNCDTVFSEEIVGENGINFCSKLIAPAFVNLAKEADSDFSPIPGGGVVYTIISGLQYGIRIEPEGNSEGKNLLVSVNGHKDIDSENTLKATLNQAGNFRAYVQKLHARIAQAKGEQQ